MTLWSFSSYAEETKIKENLAYDQIDVLNSVFQLNFVVVIFILSFEARRWRHSDKFIMRFRVSDIGSGIVVRERCYGEFFIVFIRTNVTADAGLLVWELSNWSLHERLVILKLAEINGELRLTALSDCGQFMSLLLYDFILAKEFHISYFISTTTQLLSRYKYYVR